MNAKVKSIEGSTKPHRLADAVAELLGEMVVALDST
jgi:hypothetical protein